MNSSIEEVKNTYKPYRLTKKKSVTIIDSTSGSFVIKECSDTKVKEAYNYLISRNFDYFPKLVSEFRDRNVFEYIEGVEMPPEQKALDMIDLVALLHNKTTYYKEITEDRYKEIYENIKNNIMYVDEYYNNLYNMLIEEKDLSPKDYLLMRNIYKIFAASSFASEELDNWYDAVKTDLKSRVVFVHNNLEIDHFIRNTKGYLISWEKSRIDSPILDLITFYQKEYMNFDFEPIFKRYFKNYPLTKNEKKLLFLVLSIPPIIKLDGPQMKVIKDTRLKLDYLFKTEQLVKIFLSNEDI